MVYLFVKTRLIGFSCPLQNIYRNNAYKTKLNYSDTSNSNYFEILNQFLVYLSRKGVLKEVLWSIYC